MGNLLIRSNKNIEDLIPQSCSIMGVNYTTEQLIDIITQHYNEFMKYLKINKAKFGDVDALLSSILAKTVPTDKACSIFIDFVETNADTILDFMYKKHWVKGAGNFSANTLFQNSETVQDTMNFYTALLYRHTVLAKYLKQLYPPNTTDYIDSSINKWVKYNKEISRGASGIASMATIADSGAMVVVKSPLEDYRYSSNDVPLYEISVHKALNILRLNGYCPNIPLLLGVINCNFPMAADVFTTYGFCAPFQVKSGAKDVSGGLTKYGIYRYNGGNNETHDVLDGCVDRLSMSRHQAYNTAINGQPTTPVGCNILKEPMTLSNHILTEHIYTEKTPSYKTRTIAKFIIAKNPSKEGVLSLIVQILIALQILVDRIGFLHGDCHIGNILIQQIPSVSSSTENVTFLYQFDQQLLEVNVLGGYVPMIIDFGRALIDNGKAQHWGVDISNELMGQRRGKDFDPLDNTFYHTFHPTLDVFSFLASLYVGLEEDYKANNNIPQLDAELRNVIEHIFTEANVPLDEYFVYIEHGKLFYDGHYIDPKTRKRTTTETKIWVEDRPKLMGKYTNPIDILLEFKNISYFSAVVNLPFLSKVDNGFPSNIKRYLWNNELPMNNGLINHPPPHPRQIKHPLMKTSNAPTTGRTRHRRAYVP